MARKEKASIVEYVVESLDEFFLSGLVEINHHISAEDKIEWASEGPRVHEIEVFESKDAAKGRADLVEERSGFVLFGFEIAALEFGGEVGDPLRFIKSFLGNSEDSCGDIGCEDSDIPGLGKRDGLEEGDGDGVGLFTGRTAGTPGADAELAGFLFFLN